MVNVYRTIWKNKSLLSNTGLLQPDGTTQRVNITGLTAEHKGIELEATARPVKKLFINVMASLGDWKWKNNVISYVYDDNDVLKDSVKAFVDGLKVASTAQTTFGVGGSYEVFKGLRVSTNYRYLDNIYAQFAVTDRNKPSSRQAWKLPAYGLLNASVNYRFSFDGIKYTVRLNVDNILNKQYISRANTDIPYNSTSPTDFVIGDNGSGASNQVYAGIGRTWVATLKINL
jgi:outer membrane receptor protein involved in Fe transport